LETASTRDSGGPSTISRSQAVELEIGAVEKYVLHGPADLGNDIEEHGIRELDQGTHLTVSICVLARLKIQPGQITKLFLRLADSLEHVLVERRLLTRGSPQFVQHPSQPTVSPQARLSPPTGRRKG
jgi:hypothetical protein